MALIINFCLAGMLMWLLEAGYANPDYEVEGAFREYDDVT